MYKLLLYVILLLFCQCKRDPSLKEEVTDLLRTEIVIRGDKALVEEPVTITAYRAERSTGGIDYHVATKNGTIRFRKCAVGHFSGVW